MMQTNGPWRRSTNDRMITGLCGGLGEMLNVDSSWIRIGMVMLFLTLGVGLIPYAVAYFIVPKERQLLYSHE